MNGQTKLYFPHYQLKKFIQILWTLKQSARMCVWGTIGSPNIKKYISSHVTQWTGEVNPASAFSML